MYGFFIQTGSFTVRSRPVIRRCSLVFTCIMGIYYRKIQSELIAFDSPVHEQKEHIKTSQKLQLETLTETDWRFLSQFEVSDCQRVRWSLAFLTGFCSCLASLQTNSKQPSLSTSKSLRTHGPYSPYHFI
jgi:hypothetical protein